MIVPRAYTGLPSALIGAAPLSVRDNWKNWNRETYSFQRSSEAEGGLAESRDRNPEALDSCGAIHLS
jgi:hypothetical protein